MKKTTILFLLVAVVLISAGCETPKSTVVLIPDPDGAVGSLEVANEAGTQVLREANQAVGIKDADTRPGDVVTLSDRKIRAIFAAALEAQPLPPDKFILYFKPDSNDLVPESSALLPEIIQAIHKRDSTEIVVSGHTDRVGTRDYNYRLSLERAREVFGILVANGAVPGDISVTSHGEGNPLVKTADEVAEPRNRRVEVVVK